VSCCRSDIDAELVYSRQIVNSWARCTYMYGLPLLSRSKRYQPSQRKVPVGREKIFNIHTIIPARYLTHSLGAVHTALTLIAKISSIWLGVPFFSILYSFFCAPEGSMEEPGPYVLEIIGLRRVPNCARFLPYILRTPLTAFRLNCSPECRACKSSICYFSCYVTV
jgi:hypothetical protein